MLLNLLAEFACVAINWNFSESSFFVLFTKTSKPNNHFREKSKTVLLVLDVVEINSESSPTFHFLLVVSASVSFKC